jgi:hypothetical protein
MKRRYITDADLEKIREMREAGQSVSLIAEEMGRNKTSIYGALARAKKPGKKRKMAEKPNFIDIPIPMVKSEGRVAIILTDSGNVGHVLRDLWK